MEMLKARRDSSVSLAPIPPSSAAPAPAPPPPPEPVVTPSGQTTEVEAENLLPAPPPPPAPISETQIQRGDPFRGRRVGEILIKMGKLTQQQVDHAADRARLSGERLGRYMLREGLLLPAELTRALALQSGLPMTDLSDAELPAEVRMIFPFALMQRHEFVPFDQSKKILCVATANPLSAEVVEELERIAQRHVEVFLAQEDLVLLALDKLRPVDKRTERRHVRYRAEFPVRYQFCNRLGRVVEETLHEGVTSDISEGGFMVEGPRPDLGQPEDLRRRGLCVNLTIVVVPHEIKVLCSLRFVKVHEDSKPGEYPWTFGLQVLEITESDKRKLKEACIQAGMRKPGESGGAHLKPFA
ncbi:MAG: PilZ domain-containing protein [Planctomycetota bacterium]|nr:PilZ domain-containing protein [Planctomycetota bacterium]